MPCYFIRHGIRKANLTRELGCCSESARPLAEVKRERHRPLNFKLAAFAFGLLAFNGNCQVANVAPEVDPASCSGPIFRAHCITNSNGVGLDHAGP
jgi:hypothetical protein